MIGAYMIYAWEGIYIDNIAAASTAGSQLKFLVYVLHAFEF